MIASLVSWYRRAVHRERCPPRVRLSCQNASTIAEDWRLLQIPQHRPGRADLTGMDKERGGRWEQMHGLADLVEATLSCVAVQLELRPDVV